MNEVAGCRDRGRVARGLFGGNPFDFRDVDRTGDPGYFMRFLEGVSGVERIRQLKRRRYELMQVRPGDHVLDLGCGLGDDVRALVALVGPTGRAVSIDASEAMIAEAGKRSEGTGLPVEFAVGDAAPPLWMVQPCAEQSR